MYNSTIKLIVWVFIVSKLQRALLIFFAVLVLFCRSSYSESWAYLQLFLAAILLFFGLSPANWFRRKKPVKQDIVSSLASSQENAENDFEDEELSALPTTGFLTSENLLLLKALIKLRSAEIGNIYLEVREYQKKAKDGNWVPLFMKNMAVLDLHGRSSHVEKEEEEKAEIEAMTIFEEKYKFCSFAPTDLYEDQIADLHVALLCWCYPPQTIINRLEELRSFGFLHDRIGALINAYQAIDKCGGDFSSIFKATKSERFRPSLKKISFLWSEIARIFKMSLLLQQIKNEIPNEQHANENIDLQEIEALVELESYLDLAITQENLDRKSFISHPSKEKEKLFLNHLKFNPLWYHYS